MKKHPSNRRKMIMVDTPDAPAVPPETIHVVSDAASGLAGVLVLHSTRRVPAAGGRRPWRSAHRAAPSADPLRVSAGRDYPTSPSQLPRSGGRAAPHTTATQELG